MFFGMNCVRNDWFVGRSDSALLFFVHEIGDHFSEVFIHEFWR